MLEVLDRHASYETQLFDVSNEQNRYGMCGDSLALGGDPSWTNVEWSRGRTEASPKNSKFYKILRHIETLNIDKK